MALFCNEKMPCYERHIERHIICYNRARKFRVSVPKGGHPYIVGVPDTAGLLLGVQNQLKGAVNTYLLTISKVEITGCRC